MFSILKLFRGVPVKKKHPVYINHIDINNVIFEDIDIDINKDTLENIDIDKDILGNIEQGIFENIDIAKTLYR